MNEIPAHCVEMRSDSLIVFSENKSKITFENHGHNTYRAIQVDGCVFNAEDGHKCDNLLESEVFADQYFVELKGGDSDKAVEQLKDTIDKMPPRLAGAKRMAFAVFSNTCPKNDTKRQAIEKSFRNKKIVIKFCRTGETFRLER
ncbi:MAG: hypothetical protein IJ785_06965 [Bacteroidales bacterium]|nr:hypothetical protein [Bacteroidales bacterium]